MAKFQSKFWTELNGQLNKNSIPVKCCKIKFRDQSQKVLSSLKFNPKHSFYQIWRSMNFCSKIRKKPTHFAQGKTKKKRKKEHYQATTAKQITSNNLNKHRSKPFVHRNNLEKESLHIPKLFSLINITNTY